jgi:hypothetical protein
MVAFEFSDGPKGYIQAESLVRIVRRLRTTADSDQLCDELERSALDHLKDSGSELARVRELIDVEAPTWPARAFAAWHRFWGPSSREMELSKQRGDALERAERAEHSSFEALAEMAKVERERDAAGKEIAILRQRIDRLENSDAN